MTKVSIKQVEPQFAQQLETPLKAVLKQLGYSVPENFKLRVSLLRANGRKQPSNAGASTWAPGTGRMQFWLEPSASEKMDSPGGTSRQAESLPAPEGTRAEVSQSTTSPSVFVHPAEAELLRALDRAESTPGWSFVSLKKFRDEILPSENVPSLRSDVERQNVLRSAIDKRLILKKPVPNPKSPQFPVTSIRLNRLMPEVQEVLGHAKKNLDFHPIHIKGEPLSATILRERR
jgi:hypothetical protein